MNYAEAVEHLNYFIQDDYYESGRNLKVKDFLSKLDSEGRGG